MSDLTRTARRMPWAVLLISYALLTSCAAEPAVGEPVSLTGSLRVRVIESNVGEAEYRYTLERDDGEDVRLVFDANPGLRAGAQLEVVGQFQADSMFMVTDLELLPSPKRLDAPLSRVPTTHRVLVLATSDAGMTRNHVNNEMQEAIRFFEETSDGIELFTFDPSDFHQYSVSYSNGDCTYSEAGKPIAERLIARYEAEGGDADAFEHIAVVVPRRSCSWGYDDDTYGAWANMGRIHDSGSLRFAQRSVYQDPAFKADFLAHELGHNLALDHSRSADCGGASYRPDFEFTCSVHEYGNYNDPMGKGDLTYWGSPHMRFMGWIDAERVVTAGSSGTFNLIPLDAAQDCGIQALRIPVPGEAGVYFYLEYRKTRSDSDYAGGRRRYSGRRDGVYLLRSHDGRSWPGGPCTRFDEDGDPTCDDSDTLIIPLSSATYERDDEIHHHQDADVGRTYNVGGVSFRVTSMGSTSATVEVTYGGVSSHRDDNNDAVAEVGGVVGPGSCDGAPPVDECPDNPEMEVMGPCGCEACPDECPDNPEMDVRGPCGCEACPDEVSVRVVSTPGLDRPDGVPEDRPIVAENQPFEITFANASGDTWDWVGFYRHTTPEAPDTSYEDYLYTYGGEDGTLTFNQDTSARGRSGLSAGEWEARFYFRNTYTREASSRFTVVVPDPCAANPGDCTCTDTCGESVTVQLGVVDTYVRSSRFNGNYGSATALEVDTSPTDKRAMLSPVDLSSIPSAAQIESAQLVMQVFNSGHDVSVHRLTSAWDESVVRYSSQPSAISTPLATFAGRLGEIVVDVTELVRGWVSGTYEPFGIGLYPTGSNGVDIYSSEYSDASLRPYFRITYRP